MGTHTNTCVAHVFVSTHVHVRHVSRVSTIDMCDRVMYIHMYICMYVYICMGTHTNTCVAFIFVSTHVHVRHVSRVSTVDM